ncbi:MAG: CPBP family intramembrane metalloprotease [Abitibacteriaceae bacterium]|nr:CPBP family intramembrane metalloprotease [Abditibacteriaceae bacterium]
MPAPRFQPLTRLILCVLGVVLVQVVLVLVIRSGVTTAAALSHRPAAPLVADFVSSHALLLSVLACPPTFLWIYFCRRVLDCRSFVSLGLRVRRCVRDSLLGVLAGAAAIAFLFGILYILAGFALGHPPIISWSPEAFDTPAPATVAMLVLYAGAFYILGFGEEISFRGYGLHNLAAWLGTTKALIAQAVIFALLHLSNVLVQPAHDNASSSANPTLSVSTLENALWDVRWGMVNIALIGVFFALCYLKTGSLWFPIGFHVSWNFFQGCIFSLPVSGLDVYRLLDIKEITESLSSSLTGGSFGGEGSVLLIPITSALIYFLWRQPDHPQALLDLSLLCQPEQPLQEPEPVSDSTASSELGDVEPPRYSTFKTTLRGSQNGSAHDLERSDTPLLLGVIEKPAPPVTMAPPTPTVVAFEPVVLTPVAATHEPPVPFQETVPPVSAVVVNEPSPNAEKDTPPAPAPVVTPPVPSPPASKPSTGKPPSPRW